MTSPQHRSLLTKREREIFQLLIEDYSTKDISKKLGISEKFPIRFKSSVYPVEHKR